MTARLSSRGPGLGVHTTAPLTVRCPFCHKPSDHGLIGRRDGAELLLDAVTAAPAGYDDATMADLYRRDGLTAAQTGVQLPDPMMRQNRK